MKRFKWILLLAVAAPTLLSADSKKMTVANCRMCSQACTTLGRSDDQVANELKQIQLTEELTPARHEQHGQPHRWTALHRADVRA